MADTDLREQIARALGRVYGDREWKQEAGHQREAWLADADAVLAVVTPALAAARAAGREDGLREAEQAVHERWLDSICDCGGVGADDCGSCVVADAEQAVARMRALDGPASSGKPT